GNDRIRATTARALFEARIEIAKSRRQEQYLDAKAGRHVHPDNAPVGINIENRSADKWQRLQPLIDQTELAVEKQDPTQRDRQRRQKERNPEHELQGFF